MSLIHRLLLAGFVRTRRFALLALSAAWVAAVPTPAPAQGWNFRPVFTVGVGYNSNVVFTPGDLSPGDYYGGLGLRAPLSRQLSQETSLSASYTANCEWYQDFQGLDACPSRQAASIGWSYASGDTTLSLSAGYAESRRPEEVFPEAGIDYLRGKTRNASAGANLSHRLGQRTSLGIGYVYGRPFYEPAVGLETLAQSHRAYASLSRELDPATSISLRYTYSLYLRDGLTDDSSHAVGLGFSRRLWHGAHLTMAAEARYEDEEIRVRPQGTISVGHAWRRSQISLSYSRSRNYVLSTGGFTETDSVGVSYSITMQRLRVGTSVGYSRNKFEEEASELGRPTETYRGNLNLVYMLARWLGTGATYQYSWQDPPTDGLEARRRHIAQVGFVIAPWNAGGPPNLP